MRAIDVGVGHDDDLVVAALGQIGFFADAGADGRDHAADFFVREDFVFARFVGVDDLAPQRQDGLDTRGAGLPRRCRRPNHPRRGTVRRGDVAARAIAELAGQAAAGEGALAFAEQGLRLAGGFAGLGRQHRLLGDHAGRFGVLFEIVGQKIADGGVDQSLDFDVVQLHLRLRFELRLRHADLITAVIPSRKSSPRGSHVLEKICLLAVVVQRARQGGAKAGEVRAAVDGVDIVDVV